MLQQLLHADFAARIGPFKAKQNPATLDFLGMADIRWNITVPRSGWVNRAVDRVVCAVYPTSVRVRAGYMRSMWHGLANEGSRLYMGDGGVRVGESPFRPDDRARRAS